MSSSAYIPRMLVSPREEHITMTPNICVDVGQLYRQHAPFLLRVVERMTGPGSHVHDIVQDVFVLAHQKRAVLQTHEAPRAFLYRVTMHRISEQRRAYARLTRFLTTWVHRDAAPTTTAGSAEATVVAHAEAARVRACLRTLSFADREILVLIEFEHLTTTEAAALLQIAEGTARSRLFEARRRFGVAWQKDGAL